MGEFYGSEMDARGVWVRFAVEKGDGPTGLCVVLVTPDGERTMNTHLGMCRKFSADDIETKNVKRDCLKNLCLGGQFFIPFSA